MRPLSWQGTARGLTGYNGQRSLPMMPTSRKLRLSTGIEYHVLEWDAPSDHTVVLVHGFLDMAWSWHAMVGSFLAEAAGASENAEAQAPQFHIIAPDMRGHGDSARVGQGGYYHFMDYLVDLHDVLEALGRRQVSLVGHSMGGNICAYYAGSFPGRIQRLALLEGVGPPESSATMPQRVVAWIESWRRARSRENSAFVSVEEAAERLRMHDRLLEPELARTLAERGTVMGEDGKLRFKHDPLHVSVGPYPFTTAIAESFWRNIHCPVLLVEGSESSFHLQSAELQRRYDCFANARRVVIDGAGHMIQRHQPARLAAELLRFLGGDGSGETAPALLRF